MAGRALPLVEPGPGPGQSAFQKTVVSHGRPSG